MWSGMVAATVAAGSNVTIFTGVFLASDGKWDEANAATGTAQRAYAIALEAGTDTNDMKIALPPGMVIRDDTWTWTTGQLIYLGEVSGALTAAAPSDSGDIVQIMGFALNPDTIYAFTNIIITTIP